MPTRQFFATAFSTFTVLALPACDSETQTNIDELRSVTLTDGWGEHDPTSFPEINSCEDYWNTRCSELSQAQCQYLRARYSCSSSNEGGVVVTDHFGEAPIDGGAWRVHVRGQAGFSEPADSPEAACSLIPPKLSMLCGRLATVAAAGSQLLEIAPEGGLAPVLPIDELGDELPMFDADLGLELLEPLGWTVPALAYDARVALAEHFVAEDEIMLMAGPDGTVAVSSKDIIVIRDVRCTMDKVEVCVDVDVK
jgi:hypothetical protein